MAFSPPILPQGQKFRAVSDHIFEGFQQSKTTFLSESGISLLPYVQLIVFWGVKFEKRRTFYLLAVVYKFVQKVVTSKKGFQFLQF